MQLLILRENTFECETLFQIEGSKMVKPLTSNNKPGKKATTTEKSQPASKNLSRLKKRMIVVCIGSSAGGLEALEQLFSNMPNDTGLSFVVIQHLDPKSKSAMPEILARFTKMSIQTASDGLKLKPNSIYLNQPHQNMRIHNDKLFFEGPSLSSINYPIDFFMNSLAAEKGQDAIGIILSGTGSDGTVGISSIKQNNGFTLVQEANSAKYADMPKSAIATDYVDFVLKPDKMPEKLIQLFRGEYKNKSELGLIDEDSREVFKEIFSILSARTNHDFSGYKKPTINRRIHKRMAANQIDDISDYATFLKTDEQEPQALLKDILISVTSFFRDPEAYKSLAELINPIIKLKDSNDDIRIWVIGCATGEEAYSIAILVSECLTMLRKKSRIQIYATDIDEAALKIARRGSYSTSIASDISQDRLDSCFAKPGYAYTINNDIRENIVFTKHNVISDPPFLKLDLICCRNLLIYFDNNVQRYVLSCHVNNVG